MKKIFPLVLIISISAVLIGFVIWALTTTIINHKTKRAGMVHIPAGEFKMGSSHYPDEKPPHKVYLSAYYIDKYEVSFAQYDKYCEAKGKSKPLDNGWGRKKKPVININWNEAKAYCEYYEKRLPSEAEWEKAAREGIRGKWCFGNEATKLRKYAWYTNNSNSQTHNVGTKKPNKWGIYDMHGNVWEWCADWYDNEYYTVATKLALPKNPKGPNNGSHRVLRGGSWNSLARSCRSANRYKDSPSNGNTVRDFVARQTAFGKLNILGLGKELFIFKLPRRQAILNFEPACFF